MLRRVLVATLVISVPYLTLGQTTTATVTPTCFGVSDPSICFTSFQPSDCSFLEVSVPAHLALNHLSVLAPQFRMTRGNQ